MKIKNEIKTNLESLVYKENGFFYNNHFYLYDIVAEVEPIIISKKNDYVRAMVQVVPKENACVFNTVAFHINFKNTRPALEIGYTWWTHLYIKTKKTVKELGLFKYLFQSEFVRNPSLDEFIDFENNQEIKQYITDLEKLRQDFIAKLNSYKL